jgi:Pyoverdine/dityrosine biosynthesis protein
MIMMPGKECHPSGLAYRAGLDTIEEAVISSHFMHEMCTDPGLELYGDEEFSARSVIIPAGVVSGSLIPAVLRAAEAFARDRAAAAKRRAVQNHASYGLRDPGSLGPAEFITEVMFDRHFRSGPRETCSRQELGRDVARRVAAGAPIEMVIPALPYKLSCPLKTRGQRPDLAEVNFILGLYEIVAAIEVLYREARPGLRVPLARFTVVSDGGRFNRLTNEPDAVIEAYQQDLARWIRTLRLDRYIELVDYRTLLRAGLPKAARDAKDALREQALRQYAGIMWTLFDPRDMAATLRDAVLNDPDPERANPEGRFVSLFKSLVFTVRYRTLDRFRALPVEQFRVLYRELTGHLFEPFAALSDEELRCLARGTEGPGRLPLTPALKEFLRQAMLREVWTATIAYVAEIRSDRDQTSEPISYCLPDHLRWTIHAKPGQLGLLSPSALGKSVLAWAGAAVFKRTRRGRIRLCTLPVLALEGAGAIPVGSGESRDALGPTEQPLFYVYPDVAFSGLDDFLGGLDARLVRKRAS